ncbi:hypothetical protein MWR74_006789 [Pseudomonas aeruginosa]
MTASKIQMDQIRSTSATVTGENIRAGSQKKSSLSPAEGLQGASPDATCTCPSGGGSLRHPCPAHPAVEQAGWDERAAFEAAFAAMGRPVCRADYDQDAYGTPFDDGGWTGWQARAALAQSSPKCTTCNGSKVVSTTDTDHNGDYIEAPCPKCCGTGEADSGGAHPWGEPVLIPCDCETEQAEPELEPHIPAQNIAEAAIEQLIKSGAKHYQEFHFDLHLDGQEGARPVVVTVAFSDGPSAHELRMKAEQERDAALAEVERLSESKGDPVGSLEKCMKVMYERDENAKRLEVALARVAELEGKLTDWVHEGFRLNEALAVAKAQHSAPEVSGIGRDTGHPRAVVLYLRKEPTDDDLRAIHDALRSLAAAPGKEVPQAWLDVQAERRRQITAEGWTPEHDDLYCAAELPRAAAAYILNGANDEAPAIWPFSAKWWKPRDARANYMRAGALILAEIERLDRAAAAGKEVGHE